MTKWPEKTIFLPLSSRKRIIIFISKRVLVRSQELLYIFTYKHTQKGVIGDKQLG